MRILVAVIFLFRSFTFFAQTKPATYKDYFQEGVYLLIENNVSKAQENFEKAYQLDSSSANINYMMGACYLQSALQKSRAEYYLEKAVKNVSNTYRSDDPSETAAAPVAHYYYGQALHINYQFDAAIEQFEMFRKFIEPKDEEYKKMVNKEIATSQRAKEMVDHPINVIISNLGDSVNSIYPEYSAIFSADERMLIFTTKRPNSTGGMKTDDGMFFEDIVVSYMDNENRWSRPVSISANVNSTGHEGSINLTPDGQTLIVFKNDAGKNPEGDGNIYYSTFDGKDWSVLKDFGSNVNTEYWESHACLSADGNVLFFSSERPGGFGGKDIYRCVKLPNGKWSKALNMGREINTEYDEDGGFIHPDGRTFYFASNGPRSMGGYDILFATLNEDNKFTDVTNIGYPINTTDDDIFYVSSPDGKRGYFSSAQAGGFGDKDIYRITIAQGKESFLALFKGQLIPAEGERLPDNIVIIVTDKQSHELIGSYRPKMVNGTFSTILPPGREYNFSYQSENEEFYNEDVFVSNDVSYQEIKREVELEAIRLGGKVRVKQKGIVMSALVLDNSKSKKPVRGAKLILEEEGGSTQLFDLDTLARVSNIVFKNDKKYRMYAEFNGKKSEPVEISTVGVKSAKLINQVVYMEGKPEKYTSKELLLEVTVKNSKSKRVIPEVTIILTDDAGEKQELVTDKKGVLKNIELSPETAYEVMAEKDGNVSEKETFTTTVIGEGNVYKETLLITYETPEEKDHDEVLPKHDKVPPGSRYHFTYRYGRKVINEKGVQWLAFIGYIDSASKTRPVTIYIRSNASKVPTRMKGGNKRLAAVRGNNFEALIRKNLKAREVDMSKIKFVRSFGVSGPNYRGDWKLGRRKYEKHQYVRGTVK